MGRKRKRSRKAATSPGTTEPVEAPKSAGPESTSEAEPAASPAATHNTLDSERRALALQQTALVVEREAFEKAKGDFTKHREKLGEQQAQLTDALAQAQKELEAKTEALETEWQRRQQQLAVEREKAQSELESQRAIIDAQKDTLAALKEQLTSERDAMESVRVGLESERKALQELRESLGADRLVLEDLRVGLKEDRVAVAELRQDLEERIQEQSKAPETDHLSERLVGLEGELAEAKASAREHEERLEEHARAAKEALQTLTKERDELRVELERESQRAQDFEAALKGGVEEESDPFAESTREYARETQELTLPTPKMVKVAKDAAHPFEDDDLVEDTEPGRKIAITPFDDEEEETVDAIHPAGADVDEIAGVAELPAPDSPALDFVEDTAVEEEPSGTPFDQRETQAMRPPKLMGLRTFYYRHVAQIFADGGDGAHAIKVRRAMMVGGVVLVLAVIGLTVWLVRRGSGEPVADPETAETVVQSAMKRVPLEQLTRGQQAEGQSGPTESSLRVSREAVVVAVKKAKRTPLKTCLKAAVERGELETLPSNVVLGWTIEADGKATAPVVQEPAGANSDESVSCLEKAMAKWKLPKGAGASVIRNFPLAL